MKTEVVEAGLCGADVSRQTDQHTDRRRQTDAKTRYENTPKHGTQHRTLRTAGEHTAVGVGHQIPPFPPCLICTPASPNHTSSHSLSCTYTHITHSPVFSFVHQILLLSKGCIHTHMYTHTYTPAFSPVSQSCPANPSLVQGDC